MAMAMSNTNSASSNNSSMAKAYVHPKSPQPPLADGHSETFTWRSFMALGVCAAAVLLLHACATRTVPPATDAPAPTSGSPPSWPTNVTHAPMQQAASRWVPVAWADLPGFSDDRIHQALPALQRNCDKPIGVWQALCGEAQSLKAGDDQALRSWLIQRFDAYRVEAPNGQSEGLATGYFEPSFEARRTATSTMRYPLHKAPADLSLRKPWFTRAQSETVPEAIAALRGREIAFVADPLDVLMVQIQGSGRLRVTEADGRITNMRIAFAGHNDQTYQSVGRWLIQQGELRSDNAAWPALRDWARRNPGRVTEMIHANPRLVFFKEEPLHDASVGPRGAQGVPLTPERSIAVDPKSIPYGTPLWLDTTEPLSNTPLRRLVVAQDTGSAIVGAVRADYFWGPGERAEQQASRMKQKLRLWALWPKTPAR
jgi:membrane-bound lytic murein transglycosylase A